MMNEKIKDLEEVLTILNNLTEADKRKTLKLLKIMNITRKVAGYLEERLEYSSCDTDNHNRIIVKYWIGDYKIDCTIDAKNITLICKEVGGLAFFPERPLPN